ncbi:MAG: hypothetical protein CBD21_00085 [bacterium TMED161]|nr:MAG: hypothetical protein CBD21_00085 [bacterium TMED161]|tara:strand:- start:384 stop:1217 length:834 start_codon:yes stop_codon:yes gene_type:complete
MFKKYILILFVIIGFSNAQFAETEVTLDLRNVSKNYYFLLENLKDEIGSYFTGTIFSEEDVDLHIELKIHIVVESINRINNIETINAQFFTSNNIDLNQYSKSCTFPYYKGQSISFSSEFDPLSSLLDYFAYMFIANELDKYYPLGGTAFFNLAEKISIKGKDSNYSNGWDDRWKKCKKVIENNHLRNFRFHFYELQYLLGIPDSNFEQIKSLALDLENDIYYLKEFFPNDRNAFLFLDIFSNQIGKILGELKMYESLIMLSSYDADNKLIYNSHLK